MLKKERELDQFKMMISNRTFNRHKINSSRINQNQFFRIITVMVISTLLLYFFSVLLFPPLALPHAHRAPPRSQSADDDDKQLLSNPSFAFSWLNDVSTFMAGDLSTINVKLLGDFNFNASVNGSHRSLNLTVTVNGKTGNSCYVSGVVSNVGGGDPSHWTISFTPIMNGVFNVLIVDDGFGVFDSSLHFDVKPGRLYPSACVASWLDPANDEIVAGTNVTVFVLLRDAFGNNISSNPEGVDQYNFTLSVCYANGSLASLVSITDRGWKEMVGYFSIEFVATQAGSLLLNVEGGNQTLNGCPLPFKVNPGPLDVTNCEAEWRFGIDALQLFSKMEILIHQKDQYGNLVPGFYPFDAIFIEKQTNLAIPIADMNFQEVAPGIQLFSSTMIDSGNFSLTIFDFKLKKSLAKMPYDFTVFVGYCDGLNSVINGSGLQSSVAGEVAKFSVYLNDVYQYPSPVELQWLRVQITRDFDSYPVWPSIYPLHTDNGSALIRKSSYDALSHIELAPGPSIESTNTSGGHLDFQASAFDVIFTPEKSGLYGVQVYCGNILLNGNGSLKKEVRAAEVDISLSGVIKYETKVAKLIKNEVVVHLLDRYSNPVLRQESRLNLEIGSINSSGYQTWTFVDINNGSYTGYYMTKDVGSYELCASFDGNKFLPCPFGVNVYSNEYFPRAYGDTISVWEEESIAFDALANDFFAGGNASIVETSRPAHGSLIMDGRLFRYTPYKGFFGNDSFWYTICDINSNLATASVNISVLSIPPQFLSFPSGLQATEDILSPQFGGFPGFGLRYSDVTENISVTLSAKSGSVFLAPMLMQFEQPAWSGLSVIKPDGEAKDLILEGFVEVINPALNSIKYLGDENFCGEDFIKVSTKNQHGVNEVKIPVLVEPINDPPYIHVPAYIILKSDEDEALVFNRERDKFEFSIGDPDLPHFPGGHAHFLVAFSMEVSSGFLVASLPAGLVNTTELKLRSSYQWQPLQTFVTISKHFTVKAKGIRFLGTIDDCNVIMQQLLYHGGEHGAVLTVILNDMGNFGCYPSCAENISKPLFAEATVNIIRRTPISSMAAHTLQTAIIIESFSVFSLGLVLLFFICKCAIVLANEKKSRKINNAELSKIQTPDTTPNATELLIGECSNPSILDGRSTNFRQRSRRQSGNGESCMETVYCSAQSSISDQLKQTPLPSFVPFSVEKAESDLV